MAGEGQEVHVGRVNMDWGLAEGLDRVRMEDNSVSFGPFGYLLQG